MTDAWGKSLSRRIGAWSIAGMIALVGSSPSHAQTTVTVNGRSFVTEAGSTTTFVTDATGTRIVRSTHPERRMIPTQPLLPDADGDTPPPAAYGMPPADGSGRPHWNAGDRRVEDADSPGSYERPRAEDHYEADLRPVRLRRDRETGHFIAPITLNGVPIRAIVDTGASSTILSRRDAFATGADRDVRSTRPGIGIGGYTTLYTTRVRGMRFGNGPDTGPFNADIGQNGLPYTLLGQPEIARLGRVVIEDGVMTIHPKGSSR